MADLTRDRARRGPGAEGLVGLGARAFDYRRTVADVSMSGLLSGGMDASPITGLLAETGTPDLRAYAIGFEAAGGEAAVTAARALRIPVVGVDFLVPAHDQPQHVIIEANERTGVANHEPQPVAERFMARCHARAYQPLHDQ